MYEIGVIRRFSAAHRLRNYNGKCENLHGHNYKVEVAVQGNTLVNGMLIDFVVLKQKIDTIINALDHSYLNETEPFTKIEPSAENIAEYFYKALSAQMPGTVFLSSVTVWESDDNWAIYRADK